MSSPGGEGKRGIASSADSPAKRIKQEPGLDLIPKAQPVVEDPQDCHSDTPLRHLPALLSTHSSLRPLQIRPLPGICNGKILTEKGWKLGTPWPKGSDMPRFRALTAFQHPIVGPNRNLTSLLAEYQDKRATRLRGVTFLHHHEGPTSPSWVAGLVGLRNVHQLNTWLDRDVARVVYDLYKVYHNQQTSSPTKATIINAIFSAPEKHPGLQVILDTTPGVLLRRTAACRLWPINKLDGRKIEDINVELSHVATIYRLLTSFPDRFPGHSATGPNTIMGHTHNNWQAAWSVYLCFKSRRSQKPPKRNTDSRGPTAATWFGFTTDPDVKSWQEQSTIPDAQKENLKDDHFERSLAYGGPDNSTRGHLEGADLTELAEKLMAAQCHSTDLSSEITGRCRPALDSVHPVVLEACSRRLKDWARVNDGKYPDEDDEFIGFGTSFFSKFLNCRETSGRAPEGELHEPAEGSTAGQAEEEPDGALSAIHVRTVVLEHDSYGRDRSREICRKHLADDSRDEKMFKNSADTEMNETSMKALTLSSTNPDFHLLTQANERNIKLFGTPAAVELCSSYNEQNPILQNDRTGGLQWYFYHIRPHKGIDFPNDPVAIVKFVCHQSPKLCWTIHRVLELVAQKKRVLVCVNQPLTSMVLNALLTVLGVNPLHITGHTESQCAAAVEDFNNPRGSRKVLVSSFKTLSSGMDIRGTCHHGIIAEYPHKATHLSQALESIKATSPEQKVYWDIAYLKDSSDSWMELRLMEEYREILLARIEILPDIKIDEYRSLCIYELLRVALGQNCNRMPRIEVPWSQHDDSTVTNDGHFCSAVARYLMRNPDHCTKVDENDMKKVASSWKLGQELTLDMIEGKSPKLEDGPEFHLLA